MNEILLLIFRQNINQKISTIITLEYYICITIFNFIYYR